jgi:hypothetical protein
MDKDQTTCDPNTMIVWIVHHAENKYHHCMFMEMFSETNRRQRRFLTYELATTQSPFAGYTCNEKTAIINKIKNIN